MSARWIASLTTFALTASLLAQEAQPPQLTPPAPTAPDAPVPGLSSDAIDSAPKAKVVEKPSTKGFFGPGSDIYTLSLQDAIRRALENNLEARVEKAGVSVENARVKNAYGEFDPVFSFTATRSKNLTPDDRHNITSAEAVTQLQLVEAQVDAINRNTAANQAFTNAVLQALGRPKREFNTEPLTVNVDQRDIIIFDQESDQGQVSIQARSPIGTVLRASARMTKMVNTFEGDTRTILPDYMATTSLEFRQPLLKDFGFAANLADLRIARKNREAQQLTWRFQLEATLQNVVATYYEMIFGLADLKNKGDAITEGLKLVAQNQRRKELGFLSPYEVKQAQLQLSFDRENLLLAKNVFLDEQYKMKRLVLPAFESNDRQVYLPSDIPSLKVPDLRRDELLAVAYRNRLDYRAAIIAAEAEDVRLRYARNQLYPQVDVVGSYGWSGLDASYHTAYQQMLSEQGPQWQIGITGGFPIGGVQPRAQLDAAKARKEQAILRVKSSELEVGLGVERAIELIRTNQERLHTAHLTTQVAADTVHVGLRRLEEGLISNFDLIEQQRRLYDARTRELAAVAELNKSITQLWLATGTVLENLNISLDPASNDGKTAQKPKPSKTR